MGAYSPPTKSELPVHLTYFQCSAELVSARSPNAMIAGFLIYVGLILVFLAVSLWLVHKYVYNHSSRTAHYVMPASNIDEVRMPCTLQNQASVQDMMIFHS